MTERTPVVLVVEDYAEKRRLIAVALTSWGYRVLEASTIGEGIDLTSRHRPDVVALNLSLPDTDAFEVARGIRQWSQVPIIVISAQRGKVSRIEASTRAAHIYVARPFGVARLRARIRAVLRGSSAKTEGKRAATIHFGDDLHIDVASRTVVAGGKPVHLTPIEFRLLATLVAHEGAIVTYQHLLTEVFGVGESRQVQSLRVFMTQLRRKLEKDPRRPKYLMTETGVGYRLRLG